MQKLKILNSFIKLIPLVLTSFAIYHAQTVTDSTLGLLGWEIPKVKYLMEVSLMIMLVMGGIALLIILIKWIQDSRYRKQSDDSQPKAGSLRFNRLTKSLLLACILYLVSIFLLSVGSLTSNLTRKAHVQNYHETYTQIIDKSFTSSDKTDGEVVVPQAIYGNFYRDQGLITFVILITFIFLLSFFITKENVSILFFGFMLSGLNQALLGINKYRELKADSLNGDIGRDLIYGTYGQPNWYAGHLIVGLVCTLFFIELVWKSRYKIQDTGYKLAQIINSAKRHKKVILNLILALESIIMLAFICIATLIAAALYLSDSKWGIIVGVVLITLFIIKIFLKPNHFGKLLAVILITICLTAYPVLLQIGKSQPNQLHRARIIEGVVDYYVLNKAHKNASVYIKDLMFGSGFDTLGENLISLNGALKETYNDRAHNVVLDTLAFTGITGLSIFIGILYLAFTRFNLNSTIESFALFGIFIIIFRTIIHEYGITNTFDLLIFFSILISFLTVQFRKKFLN